MLLKRFGTRGASSMLEKREMVSTRKKNCNTARVKQTRDANRKRLTAPFRVGDLVYLSSKNISFPKGLARKLIPKFLEPYKVLHDYSNSSFQLDLPPHLKKWGVHNIFHSSLLRIHVPNDDRLFPGRTDAQITEETTADDVTILFPRANHLPLFQHG